MQCNCNVSFIQMKGEAASVFLCAASTYEGIDDKAGFFGWLTKENPFARK